MLKSHHFVLLLLALAIGWPAIVFAQKQQQVSLFQNNSILTFKMKSNYRKLLKDVGEDTKDYRSKIIYTDSQGEKKKINLDLETRGNFRSKPGNCDFPPLELEFKDFSETAQSLFEGQGELKLVTHCQQEKPAYEQHVYKEYLIYRLYNLLTPKSFKVRLCQVNYKQTWSFKKNVKPAFLIEDNAKLAERFHGEEMDNDDDYMPLDTTQLALMAFFEYMIGNTDWSIEPLQNVEIIKTSSDDRFPVPYDFDLSAFVNTPYAPQAMFKDSLGFLKREYKGPAFRKPFIDKTFEVMNSKKQDILLYIRESFFLKEEEKHRLTEFIREFYREINNGKENPPWEITSTS
ncbi:MAG: hypothetical protein K9J27_03400 [Bacteroidales bacterium]|nr:hypothetical protein [Bacteroidales bacterium]MCF8332821.1 hypothetical protein [Bacteroidales bacterium]